jgi:hypothetical protein
MRYAESDDGLTWHADGRVAVDFAGPGEYAMGRPCVTRDDDRYTMWFCVRGDTYRLACAESADGLLWQRREPVLQPAPEGWESRMQAYPVVVSAGGRRHLLYNGDDYGRTGIGYATEQGAAG